MRQVVGAVTGTWELGPFRSRFRMLLVHEASSQSCYWNMGAIAECPREVEVVVGRESSVHVELKYSPAGR